MGGLAKAMASIRHRDGRRGAAADPAAQLSRGPRGSTRGARPIPTLGELAAQKLREAILSGRLEAGGRLVQEELCARIGVSRTCVREALQQLENEGLVERSPTQGHRVASISSDEARQIYEIRAALEPAMARRFVERAGDKQIAALADTARRIADAVSDGQMNRYVAGLHDFYHLLLEGAGNEVAWRFLGTLDARVTYLRRVTAEKAAPARRAETAALLQAIVEALRARDAEAAATRCRDFVLRSARFALAMLDDMAAENAPSPARRARAAR